MERLRLKVGEEGHVRLPPVAGGDWRHDVQGMASAVSVQRLWATAPYPEDDDEDVGPGAGELVFRLRGLAPGSATVRFVPVGGGGDPHEVTVEVSL